MEIKFKSEDITNALNKIENRIDALSRGQNPRTESDDKLFSSITKRLADTEARLEKLESLLTRKTPAGDTKLSERGKEISELWYKKNGM